MVWKLRRITRNRELWLCQKHLKSQNVQLMNKGDDEESVDLFSNKDLLWYSGAPLSRIRLNCSASFLGLSHRLAFSFFGFGLQCWGTSQYTQMNRFAFYLCSIDLRGKNDSVIQCRLIFLAKRSREGGSGGTQEGRKGNYYLRVRTMGQTLR